MCLNPSIIHNAINRLRLKGIPFFALTKYGGCIHSRNMDFCCQFGTLIYACHYTYCPPLVIVCRFQSSSYSIQSLPDVSTMDRTAWHPPVGGSIVGVNPLFDGSSTDHHYVAIFSMMNSVASLSLRLLSCMLFMIVLFLRPASTSIAGNPLKLDSSVNSQSSSALAICHEKLFLSCASWQFNFLPMTRSLTVIDSLRLLGN